MPTAYGFTEYGGTDTQSVLEVTRPVPGPSELLVSVRAAGVNPVDWKIRQGFLAEVAPRELPAVLGNEVSGVVAEVGGDVEGFAVGDEVFGPVASGHGGYAEFSVLPAAGSAHKPVAVSFTDAATLAVAAGTAVDGLRQLALTAGQTVLVNGVSGGVGVAAAQVARDLGLTVVGTAGPANQAFVESLGVVFVPYGDGVADRVRELLPDGVDGVLDVAGGDSLRAVVGLAPSPSSVVTTADPATAAEIGAASVVRVHTTENFTGIAQLVADGKLDPRVQDVIPLERAADALASVESGARGKVVISVP